MITEVHFEKLQKVRDGVDKLANAVKSTLGPGGQGVVIKRKHTSPFVTKDGVTVAQSIFLEDPIEDIGAQMVKEVANKTVEGAGDGTTTATVLAQAIFTKGLNELQAGVNPVEMKKGIDMAVKEVTKRLAFNAKATKDPEKIKQVATISANYDEVIGSMIADAVLKIGDNGYIAAEESNGTDTYVKITEGMQLERGYLSPHFVNNVDKMVCEMVNPYILITDKRINTISELLPILEQTSMQGRPLLIIADDVEGEALATLVINKNRGAINVCATKVPFLGGQKSLLLEDIAIATGGKVLSEEAGYLISKCRIEDLGSCDKLTVSRDTTVIVNGHGDKENIKKRITQLRNELEATSDEYEKHRLKSRLAKIDGGIAIIYVGGYTEVEMKERKFRVDDAIFATVAAIEEGIIPGGGIAYLKCSHSLQIITGENDDQTIGIRIVMDALRQPLRTLAENQRKSYDSILKEIQNKQGELYPDWGWNARTDKFGDMIEMGIIDPVKVVRLALENAASVAGLLLNTRAIVVEKLQSSQS